MERWRKIEFSPGASFSVIWHFLGEAKWSSSIEFVQVEMIESRFQTVVVQLYHG